MITTGDTSRQQDLGLSPSISVLLRSGSRFRTHSSSHSFYIRPGEKNRADWLYGGAGVHSMLNARRHPHTTRRMLEGAHRGVGNTPALSDEVDHQKTRGPRFLLVQKRPT
jgi:hypothetical protein